MMTEAIEPCATVAKLPIAANVDAAWARYTAVVARSVADPSLLTDRDYCSSCVRAWAAFRDLMIASDSMAADGPALPATSRAAAIASGDVCHA